MPKKVDHAEIIRFALNRAYWFGSITRRELTRRFEISDDLASRIIRKLRDDGILYASGHQLTLLPLALKSELVRENVCAERFLAELTLLQRSDQDITLSCGGQAPNWSTSSLMRTARPEVLREVLAAIRETQSVEILYVEKGSHEAAVRRTVEPIELLETGGRWSVDAYCYVADKRQDFDLLYVVEAKNRATARYRMAAQSGAQNRLTMMEATFVPHPALGEAQKSVVTFQFQMRDGVLNLKAPRAHVNHLRERFVAPTPFKVDGEQVLFEHSAQQSFAAEFGLYACAEKGRSEATMWKERAYVLLQALEPFVADRFGSSDRLSARAWLMRLLDLNELAKFVYAPESGAAAHLESLRSWLETLPGAREGLDSVSGAKLKGVNFAYSCIVLEIKGWLRNTSA